MVSHLGGFFILRNNMKFKDWDHKAKEILLPFIKVALGFVVTYSALRYFLDIKWGVLPLKEDLLDLVLPGLIGWAVTMYFLGTRTRLLRFKNQMGKASFIYSY